MASLALLCTDGSDYAIEALRVCLPLLAPLDRTMIVTVESPVDPDAEVGIGFEIDGSAEDVDVIETSGDRVAKFHLDRTAAALDLPDAELRAVVGQPGPAICELAGALAARVVVIGTSGRGGLRRAFVGSTSDHVIRHAPCPVLVQAVGRH